MKIYFTLTGTNHYYGKKFLEKDMEIHLEKEPENDYDPEAIRVDLEGMGKIGYVANSPYTLVGKSYSAGRMYDKIGDTATGTVLYNLDKGVLCWLETEKHHHHDDRNKATR